MTCRICYENEPIDKLVSVCGCRGTAEFVHVNCIVTWIRLSRRTSCEICHEPYNISYDFPGSGIWSILMGMVFAISHVFLLENHVNQFPKDFYSVIILATMVNSIQFVIWRFFKRKVLLQIVCAPLWFLSYFPLSLVLQYNTDGLSVVMFSWIPTTIFYMWLTFVSWSNTRQN